MSSRERAPWANYQNPRIPTPSSAPLLPVKCFSAVHLSTLCNSNSWLKRSNVASVAIRPLPGAAKAVEMHSSVKNASVRCTIVVTVNAICTSTSSTPPAVPISRSSKSSSTWWSAEDNAVTVVLTPPRSPWVIRVTRSPCHLKST